VQTEPATYVGKTTAVVWAKISYPEGAAGTYWFERSHTGGWTWVKAPARTFGPMANAGEMRVAELLGGLTPGTTYKYRICVDLSRPDIRAVCMTANGGPYGPYDSFRTAAAEACSATLSPGGSLQSFINARSAGQVACLSGGTYSPHSRVVVSRDITLQPVPGATVKIEGELALEADGATVRDIYLLGTEEIRALDIKANNVTVENMDITRHSSNDTSLQGIIIGASSERAANPVIRNTRIHGIGSRQSEVGCCAHDHAIYCQNASGLVAEGNWIYRNRDGYGFHLYPDCDNGRIRFNVSANNDHGDVIAGNGSRSSSGNVLEYNSYSNNSGWYRANRTGVGCSEPGSGNVVRNINVYPSAGTDCPFGFTNVTGYRPIFAAESLDDYRLTGPQGMLNLLGLYAKANPGPRR
jgi:hypothetical protein